MALSESFTGTTNNQYITPKITWSATQDVSGNYSTVTAILTYSRTNTGYTTYGTWSGTITINGTETSDSKRISITYNSNTEAIRASIRVPHNNDGTKSITISATGKISGTTLDSTSISKTIALNTIPRASSITSAGNVTLSETGTRCSIKWTPLASTFKYKLKFVCGSVTKFIEPFCPETTSAYTYTKYPMTISMWAKAMPNAYSATCTVTLYTYTANNVDSELTATSKAIGSSSKTFTLTLPTSIKPTVSLANPTLVDGWNGYYIQGKSKCTLSASFAPGSGSSIKSCSISGTGLSKTGTTSPLSGTTNVLTTSGNITYTARVEDKRTSTSVPAVIEGKSIIVRPYAAPTLTFTAQRTTTSGSIKITYRAACSPVDSENKNLANKLTVLKIYKKLSTEDNWPSSTIEKITLNATSINTTNITLSGFDANASYDIKAVVSDNVSEHYHDSGTDVVVFVPSEFRIVNIRSNKKGIAIGKMSEDNTFDCGIEAKFAKNVACSGNVTCSGDIKINGEDDTGKSYTAYIRSDPNDTDSNILYMMLGTNTDGGKEAGIAIHKNSVYVPHQENDGVINLGHGSRKWKQVYAFNDTISTSDRKEKTDIVDMSDAQEQLFNQLRPVTFKFVKGSSGRTHYGFISQDIEESLDELELTGQDFAGFCKDLRVDDNGNAILDESNNKIYDYSLRYSEFIALNTYMIQKLQIENKELKAELQALREMIMTNNASSNKED